MAITPGSIHSIVETQLAKNQFNSMASIAMISQRLMERSREDSADVAVDFDRGDLIRATQGIARMVAFKEKISDSVGASSKAKDAINSVKNYLTKAKTQLNQILGSTSGADRSAVANDFNGHLKDINAKVNGASQQVGTGKLNLVGDTKGPDWKTDDIFSPTSDTGSNFVRIEGAFLGVDFSVTDTDGFNWRLDDIDNTFYQYKLDGSGQRTGQSMPSEGLTVESYDPSNGAITYGGTGSLSGTLEKVGLNLLTSEYYNDFVDDTAVTTAINDIDNALAIVTQKGSSIMADAAVLKGRVNLIDSKIKNLEDEKNIIMSEELEESVAVSKAADLKLNLAINRINLLSQAGNGLIENLLSLSNGPQKAPGLLGLMGY